eukprot:m.118823 g.118823  ORF g.118823 m.118823 type:complete len:428 (-) comp13260_c1_seq4:575-1858(-)
MGQLWRVWEHHRLLQDTGPLRRVQGRVVPQWTNRVRLLTIRFVPLLTCLRMSVQYMMGDVTGPPPGRSNTHPNEPHDEAPAFLKAPHLVTLLNLLLCQLLYRPSGYDTPNACDPTATTHAAYACMDWGVGSGAMIAAAVAEGMNATHFFGVGSYGSGNDNLGKCFEIDIGIGRLALLQVVNTGGDVATGQFDLQMGDGGFGVFNACAAPTTGGAPPMFSGPTSAFGTQYGGWTHKADCVQLPKMPQTLPSLPPNEPDLVGLCEAGFNIGCRVDGGQNPSIKSARRVVCPAALVKLTGLNRTDGGNQESHGAGTLTRMMDCCKPSAGWTANIQYPDPNHPAVIPCTSDGYTRVSVGPPPAPGPPSPGPPPPSPLPPPPPSPPAPPSPGGCPGGSLEACIALCPPNPPAAYKACVESCAQRCTAAKTRQ